MYFITFTNILVAFLMRSSGTVFVRGSLIGASVKVTLVDVGLFTEMESGSLATSVTFPRRVNPRRKVMPLTARRRTISSKLSRLVG